VVIHGANNTGLLVFELPGSLQEIELAALHQPVMIGARMAVMWLGRAG
jgi:hypothetical protein